MYQLYLEHLSSSHLIEALGVIPYGYLYIIQESYIALVVLFNGLLYHLLFPHNVIIRFYDIMVNCIMILYVNAKMMNTCFVMFMTFVSFFIYLFNIRYERRILRSIIHVVGVQWWLGILLYNFNSQQAYTFIDVIT